MTQDEIIEMAKQVGFYAHSKNFFDCTKKQIEAFAKLVAVKERERICKAIKEEDDYCVDEGDYMLDSDDCIKVAMGKWKRPDYGVDAIQARDAT